MIYKGYTLKLNYSFTLPFGGRVTGVGIFKDNQYISVAQDKELAMRWVDEKEKSDGERLPTMEKDRPGKKGK